MLEPLSREGVADQLSRRLADAILTGGYEAGALLPTERELSASHGVTRNTVKQALVRLEQLGLIETRHGVGSTVRDVADSGNAALLPLFLRVATPEWVADLLEARALVGVLLARQAATRRSDDLAAQLSDLVDDLLAAPDAATAQQRDADVHRRLAHATGNRVFVLFVNSMLDTYLALGELVRPVFADSRAIAALLRPVVEAVARGDDAAAGAAAADYFATTGAAMTAALEAGGAP